MPFFAYFARNRLLAPAGTEAIGPQGLNTGPVLFGDYQTAHQPSHPERFGAPERSACAIGTPVASVTACQDDQSALENSPNSKAFDNLNKMLAAPPNRSPTEHPGVFRRTRMLC